MATCVTCLYGPKVREFGCPDYLPKVRQFGCPDEAAMRTAGIVDSILFIALFTIGILAVIGSGTPVDHPLHGIGSLGALGGSLMMVGGILIGLPGCCCAVLNQCVK